MTTNQRAACLTGESMERLAKGEIPPAELAHIEEHVSSCEHCRHMLESASLDSQWHDEVLPVLRTPSEGNGSTRTPQDAGHDEHSLESVLQLLGPTDDPHKLGRIGTYEVTGVIGRGGMGVVFKAFDAALNRFVAIKMLLPHLAVSGAARKRFAREGQAAAAVIDDNVLPIYGVAEWQGVPYLVTKYSRGMTLQKRIQDQGPLELKEILRIGMQTARGLAAAHTQGLVHRDVKPSNILLDGTVERALLTDFGLARAVDDASITRTGVIAGTPQYMSPEQARGDSVDARSDLFGLGCVLYSMCTGRPPFRADNSYAVLRLITDAEPRPIQEINPDVPEWLCGLVSKLMSKAPADRFESASVIATLLEQCLAHVQQPTVIPLPAQVRVEKAANERSRSGRWIVVIGAMLIGLLGLFGFVISLQSQDGTLLIESSVDDVTVRVSQGDAVVRKLTVTKAGTKIDVAAGSYTVAVEGNVDGISIENDKVNLSRGGTEIVKLTYQRPAETTLPPVGSTVAQQTTQKLLQQIIERTVLYVTDVRAVGQVLYFTLHRRGEEPPVNVQLQIRSRYEKPVPFDWSGPIDAEYAVMPGGHSAILLPLIPAEGTKAAVIFHDVEAALLAENQLSSIGDRSLLLEQLRATLASGTEQNDGIVHGVHPTGGKYSIEFSMVLDSTRPSSLNLSISQDIPHVPVDQQVKVQVLEQAIFVTDVRSDGQVMYFTLNQRKMPEGALGLLEIQFRCDKPMPLVWTGPSPDAATVLGPKHTVEWLGIENLPMIPLPIAAEGHKVAFIFPDNDSAVVAAKQLAAIGDQSLLDAQRRANSIDGRLRDDGIIFGEHAAIGNYSTHFRVLVRTSVPPEQPNEADVPANWFHADPYPMRGSYSQEPWGFDRMYVELAATSTAQKELNISEDQIDRIKGLETLKLPFNSESLAVARTQVNLVLNQRQQDRLVQLVWQRFGFQAFRHLEIQQKLGFSGAQRNAVNTVWSNHRAKLAELDQFLFIQKKSHAEGTIDAKALEQFTKQRTLLGIESHKRAWAEVYHLLSPLQRQEFEQLRGTIDQQLRATDVIELHVSDVGTDGQVLYFTLKQRGELSVVNAFLEIQFHCERPMEIVETGPVPDAETVVRPQHTVLWLGPTDGKKIGFGYPVIELPIAPKGHRVAFIFPDKDTAVVAAKQLAAIGDQSLLAAQLRANAIKGRLRNDGIIYGEHPEVGRLRTEFRVLHRMEPKRSLNISGNERPQLNHFPNAFEQTVPDSWFRRDPFKELSKSPENPVGHIRMALELVAWEPAQHELELTAEQQAAVVAIKIASMPTDPFGTVSVATEAAREKVSAILTPEQQTRLDQLVWQRLAFEAFETPTMQSQLELVKEQKQRIRQAFVDHKQRTLLYDAAIAELRQSGMADAADIALAADDREVLGIASLKKAWDVVYLLLTEKQRDKFELLRGPLTKYEQQSNNQDLGPESQMSREAMLQKLAQEKAKFPLYDSILAKSSVLAEKLRLAERVLYDDRQAYNVINTALSNDFQQWQRDYRSLLRAKEIIPGLTKQPEHRPLMLWAAEYHATNRFSKTQIPTLEQLRAALPSKPSEEQLLQFLRDVSCTDQSIYESAVKHNTITPTLEQQSHCHEAELLRTIQDIQSLYIDVAHHTSHVSVLQRYLDHTGATPPTESQSSDTGQLKDGNEPVISATLMDILAADIKQERARLPLLDMVLDDIRLMEGGGLEILERPVREDREQYAKEHPELAKAFETWQNDFRYVLRTTEIIPELFEDEETRPVMVTVARLLIQSEDFPDVRKEQLTEAHKTLGENPSDEQVTKIFIGLLNDKLPLLRRRLRESGESVPHTEMHEDHLRVSERLRTHNDFARLYCAIENSEMFRQIRKLQESVDPATTFLFEESHPIAKSQPVVFISSRGREEVRAGERAYHALPEPSATVTWKAGEQEARLKNADAVQVTHVIIDRRTDGSVIWRCFGIPQIVSVIDDLNAVLPQEGIVDLNVLANSTEEAKVRAANRRLRDPNAALLTELQGTWLMTAIVAPDRTIEPVSDPVSAGHSVHFKDSTVALYQSNDQEPLPLKFTIDASTPTPEIDIEGHNGIFTLGLIETKNGTLHLQLGEAGGKRPSDSIEPAVHCQYRRIPASLVALSEQKTEGALNLDDVQQQEAVMREANRQLKDPNRVLLAQLQGTWTVTAMVLPNGQLGTVSNPAETGMMIRFDDKSGYISQSTGDEGGKFTYTIDASTSPAEIDLRHANGTHVLGLLEIKNGTLELQLGAGGDARPSPEVKPSIHQLYRRTSVYWQWIPSRE